MRSLLLHWLAVPGGPQRLAKPHQGTFASSSVVRGTRDQPGNSQPMVKNFSTPQGQFWIVAVVALVAGAPIGGLIAAARRGAARGRGGFVAFHGPRTVQRNAAPFHLLETQDGTARNGTALRPTSALRDDSHEETTKFRFAVTKVSFERQKTEITE